MRNLLLLVLLASGCVRATTGEREILLSGYGAITTACRTSDSEDVKREALAARGVLRAMRPLLGEIDRAGEPGREKLLEAYDALKKRLVERVRAIAKAIRKEDEPLSDALHGYAEVLAWGDVSEVVLNVADQELTDLIGD